MNRATTPSKTLDQSTCLPRYVACKSRTDATTARFNGFVRGRSAKKQPSWLLPLATAPREISSPYSSPSDGRARSSVPRRLATCSRTSLGQPPPVMTSPTSVSSDWQCRVHQHSCLVIISVCLTTAHQLQAIILPAEQINASTAWPRQAPRPHGAAASSACRLHAPARRRLRDLAFHRAAVAATAGLWKRSV